MRILFLILISLSALALPAQTNKKIRNLQSQQSELKKQISESEQLLRSTKKDVKSQLNNLALISGQITEKQRYIDGIQSEVDTLESNIGILEKQLAELQKDLQECKRKYQRSVMYMFRNRMSQNKLMFVFSAKDFRQMYRRMRYVMEYSKYQRAQGEIVKNKETAVREKQAELLSKKSQKNRLLTEGRTEHAKLESQKKERQAVVDELNKKSSQLQASIRDSKRKADALNARIEKLIQQEIEAAERRRKAEEARRKAAAEKARREREARERAAAKAKSGGKSTASKSGTTASGKKTATPAFTPESDVDRKLSNNFAANKGRLPVPITGSYIISSRYGQYNVDGLRGVQLDNKGINLTGRRGAQARCVFNGEVTTVFQFGGLYNIIVRHGSYISVYCNLSSASVRQGQKVTTGQTLGAVAPDASGNCTLHFQLRKETAKLNPEQWIAR